MNNAELLTHGNRVVAKKKKQKKAQIAEIKWDNDTRREYLTGFRKRKQQRQKKAQEKAIERAKEEKRQERKMKRDAEKEMLDGLNLHKEVEESNEEEEEEEQANNIRETTRQKEYKTVTSITTVTIE